MTEESKAKIKARVAERYAEARLAYVALMMFYPLMLEDLVGEIWKWISGYEGLYQVSNYGRIKTFPRHSRYKEIMIRRPALGTGGYLQVGLHKNGISKTFDIHRLVAQAFIPNPNNLPEVNHKFGNKFDNYAENLEWCTGEENKKHASDFGLTKKGSESSRAKLTAEQVRYIRENYKPYDPNFGASALARKFNVSPRTIIRVVNGITYKNDD